MYALEKNIHYKQSIQISLLANKPLIRQLSAPVSIMDPNTSWHLSIKQLKSEKWNGDQIFNFWLE